MSFHLEGTGTKAAVLHALAEQHEREDARLYNERLNVAQAILAKAVDTVRASCSLILGGIRFEIRGHFDSNGNGSLSVAVHRVALVTNEGEKIANEQRLALAQDGSPERGLVDGEGRTVPLCPAPPNVKPAGS